MKLKNIKYKYVIIPLGLLIKVALTILLLNLPGGCSEEKNERFSGKQSGKTSTISISPVQ
jgi:hypothetical protein